MPIIAGKGGGIFKSGSTSATNIPDATAVGEINSWELNIAADTLETTAFSKTAATTSAKSYVAGTYGWKVTANGFMENSAAGIVPGTNYRLLMRESSSGSTYLFYTGIAICDGDVEAMDVNGQATRNYTFTGTGTIDATYSTTITFI